MIKTKDKIHLTKRDYSILIFLWRWKYVSNKAIWIKYFPEAKLATCYRRLYELKRAKYISTEPVRWKEGYAWRLTRKGYGAIINDLPEVEKFGYGGEFPKHDFLVSAVHLGDWLVDKPQNVGIFSEQQIRRIEKENFPSWVPKSDLHNPDGYWGFNTERGTKLISLEVELSRKMSPRYEKTIKFYRRHNDIDFCLWVVPTLSFGKRIFEIYADALRGDTNIHQFALADDVIQSNWNSTIRLGSWKNKKIKDLLTTNAHKMNTECPQNSVGLNSIDTRISY